MNYNIFKLINNLAGRNALIDEIMLFSSRYLPYIMFLFIVMVYVIGVARHRYSYRKFAVNSVLLITVCVFIKIVTGHIFYNPRPSIKHTVNLLYPFRDSSTFPSNHTTFSMNIALEMGRLNRVLGVMLMVLSILIGFSRVYTGQHYPFDILGSYLISIIIYEIYHKFFEKYIDRLCSAFEKTILKIS